MSLAQNTSKKRDAREKWKSRPHQIRKSWIPAFAAAQDAAVRLQACASASPVGLCTYSQPKRPLIQRFPLVMSWSKGEVALTILLS